MFIDRKLKLRLFRELRQVRFWRRIISISIVLFLIGYWSYWHDDLLRNVFIVVKVHMLEAFVSVHQTSGPPNCNAIIQGDRSELKRARTLTHTAYPAHSDIPFPDTRNECEVYTKTRRYILESSEEERDFPIAFGIVAFKDSLHFERLLRSVYRPSNFYCIHIDSQAKTFLGEVKKLVQCFPNVFIASRLIHVVWAEYSVLEADLICMKDLLSKGKWKYFINLTGQEFPLKTNYQLVKILKAFNGSNNVAGTLTRYTENGRRWINGPPPHGLRPVMGSVHVVVNRHFVDFAINSRVARDLSEWVKYTIVPDETFYSTLNYNPQLRIPGTYQGEPIMEPFPIRFKNWDHGYYIFQDDCQGKYVRDICIFGVGDVMSLTKTPNLIANKFHIDFQPAALDCVEQWYFDMVRHEHSGQSDFDISYYRNLEFVKNQIRLNKSKYVIDEEYGTL